METNINRIINAREIFTQVTDYPRPMEFLNSVTWTGACAEIVDALMGSDAHSVEVVDGAVVIWRKDSQYIPQFIQINGTGYFFSTTWKIRSIWS